MRASKIGWLLISTTVALYAGCGDDDSGNDSTTPTAGAGGTAGRGGSDGEAGSTTETAGAAGSGESGAPGSTSGGQGGSGEPSGSAGAGGAGEEPAEIVYASDLPAPTGIALDADNVYWADELAGTIVSCPLSGCGVDDPVEVVTDQDLVRGIAVDATSVYWIRDNEADTFARLRRCPLAGCAGEPEVLAELSPFRPVDVHVDGDLLYYGAWPMFGTCPVEGCLDSGLVDWGAAPVVSVDTDADYFYYAAYGFSAVHRCALPDCTDDTPLVSETRPFSVAVDETWLYFSAYDYFDFNASDVGDPSDILRCPIEGCGADEPEVLRTDTLAYAIAVNGTRLFFTDLEHGTVVSIPKSAP